MPYEKPDWQVFAANGEPVEGSTASRTQFAQNQLIYKAASHVWIWRKTGDTIEVMLQVRSKDKPTWPGYYDASTAGHLDRGESFIKAARREAEEEIGFDLDTDQLYWCFAFRQQPSKTMCHVYIYRLDEPTEFVFNDGEVEELVWVSADTLRAWAKDPESHKLVGDEAGYFGFLIDAIQAQAR